MDKKKSAKDIAFEKERAKFRKEIQNLERELKKSQTEITELKSVISKKDDLIEQQQDWIERFLEYTEIPKEDLHKLLDNEAKKIELREKLCSTLDMFRIFNEKSPYLSVISEYLYNKNNRLER